MPTTKNLSNLVVNKIENYAVYKYMKDNNLIGADEVCVVEPTAPYTHPAYTARTGVPAANQTPAFGGSFTVTQPASDATGHITSMTSRTITIPSTVASASTNGLMSSAMYTKLNGLSNYTHPNSGVTAGTYNSVTVNAAGHVTAGSNVALVNDSSTTDTTKGWSAKKLNDTVTQLNSNLSGKADVSTLANTFSSLGYSKFIIGSYIGDDTGTFTTGGRDCRDVTLYLDGTLKDPYSESNGKVKWVTGPKKITFSFTPQMVVLIRQNIVTNSIHLVQNSSLIETTPSGYSGLLSLVDNSVIGAVECIRLSQNILYVASINDYSNNSGASGISGNYAVVASVLNRSDTTYYYIAFA